MKTTIELPDDLFREAKAHAALRGESLKNFVREALEEKLGREAAASRLAEPAAEYPVPQTGRPPVAEGGSRPVDDGKWPYPPDPLGPEERRVIDEAIEEAFEQVNPETWK